jgi:hypothetical protein
VVRTVAACRALHLTHYLASQYLIQKLRDQCSAFISQTISRHNAQAMLEQALKWNVSEIAEVSIANHHYLMSSPLSMQSLCAERLWLAAMCASDCQKLLSISERTRLVWLWSYVVASLRELWCLLAESLCCWCYRSFLPFSTLLRLLQHEYLAVKDEYQHYIKLLAYIEFHRSKLSPENIRELMETIRFRWMSFQQLQVSVLSTARWLADWLINWLVD